MKNKKFYIFLIISVLSLSLRAQHEGCNHGDAPSLGGSADSAVVQVPPTARKNINLEVAVASERKIDTLLTAVGNAEYMPQNIENVSSRIEGRITELYVRPDELVKKGAPVVMIESRVFGNPPPTVTLYAPRSGTVENIFVAKGSPVTPNEKIATVSDTSKIYAVARVFESAVSKLKIGQTARIRFEAFPDEVYAGKLVKFASSLSRDNSTLAAYFEIDNRDLKIKSGMRAVFSIVLDGSTAKVAVPKSAIIGDHGNFSVFVRECPNDMVFEKRHVATGKSDDTHVEILDGVKAGESVASRGVYQLQFMPPPSGGHSESDNAEAHGEAEKDGAHSHSEKCSEDVKHADEAKKDSAECAADHDHSEHEKGEAETHGEKSYFDTLLFCVFGASILLNAIFVLSQFVSRRKDGSL